VQRRAWAGAKARIVSAPASRGNGWLAFLDTVLSTVLGPVPSTSGTSDEGLVCVGQLLQDLAI
jgi:hypothetical protein